MKQKYYTLAEAAHWIAFGTPRPTIEQIISEQNKLQTAAQRLPAALASGTIKVFGQRDFNSDSEQITDLDYVSLDFEENTMKLALNALEQLNMIVTDNGKKIFPEEIEVLLEKCECIKECMAYGAFNDLDETVVAVKIFPNYDELEKVGISKDDPEIEEKMQSFFLEFVKNKVNKNLPGYKAVHKITIRHREFDKTTTQKIKRMSEDNVKDD
jgi:hypothetical protein